jgi:tRNA A-37 threonylcarbamoyl transferase component Bud32
VKTIARTIGRYELLRVIGRGGMATVYLARQTDLDRHVAVKELVVFDGSDPRLSRRFLQEARLAGAMSHPNIVTVHDYVEHDGVPYIAMEYLPRGSLRPFIGRLSLAQVGGVLQGLLGGLAHAEQLGVVHRDMKPENVMVTAQGTVKIADFGIAKATSAAATSGNLTTTGTTLGTPRYMAPERAMAQEVGPWSDLFSVGIMAFELLVGRTPFHDTEAPMAILMRQINDPVPPVSSLRPDVDPAISAWVDRLLVKNPDGRIRSAATAWSELDEILGEVLGPSWQRDAPLPSEPAPVTHANAAAATAGIGPDRMLAETVAPATERLVSRRARRGRLPGVARLVLVGATLAMAIVAAIAAGGGSADAEPVTADNGVVALTAPVGWQESGVDSSVPLPLSDPVAVDRGDGASVVAGLMPGGAAADASLTPDFVRSLGQADGQIPPRMRATLGPNRIEAWRYEGLRPDGTDRPLTVYVVPATAGAAAVVCIPPAGSGFARGCESIADSLQIRGGRTSPAVATPDDAAAPSPMRTSPSEGGSSTPRDDSGVGDSRSDDPSDDEPDEPDEDDNGS